MKNFYDISATSSSSQMADLTAEIFKVNSVQILLQQCDFSSEKQVAKALRESYECIINDAYLRSDDVRKNNPILYSFYNRYKKHYTSIAFEGYCEREAGSMWFSHFAKNKRDNVLRDIAAYIPDAKKYAQIQQELQRIYHFSNDDLKKLELFIAQVKIGRDFPDSLRRMLYLYSEKKKTGKTTFARILAEVLNGYECYQDSSEFNSSLSVEMQIANYAVPKVATYSVVILDECFYADMAKTYNKFKEIITSRDGEGRLPYGQPFKWEGVRNYIATSNDNLQNFINDWSDRRFYNIEFREPEQVSEYNLFKMISDYVRNVPTDHWREDLNAMFELLEVEGAKTLSTNEYAIEMQQDVFATYIRNMPCNLDIKFHASNRLTLKKIVDFFGAQKGSDAAKHRKEIERAFVSLFGQREKQGYWLLPDIKSKLNKINEEEEIELPF